MPATRHFLGFDLPATAAAAKWLIARYATDRALDLSTVMVVTPGRRAGRRLIQSLVQRWEQQEQGPLIPPKVVTIGELPEKLYEASNAAGPWTARLAMAWALRQADPGVVAAAMGTTPEPDQVIGWFRLADELTAIHEELAGENLAAAMVGDERWDAIDALISAYTHTLATQGLADQATQRRQALAERRCATRDQIVLLGVVDMPGIAGAMLEAVADHVTALIHAEPADADTFDHLGRLVIDAWHDRALAIDPQQVIVADRPVDQADAVLRAIERASGAQPLGPDQITVGVGDTALAPLIVRALEMSGVDAHQPPGRKLAESRPALLLSAAAAFLHTRRYDDLAALVRHPDLDLAPRGVEHWQTLLDEYLTQHVQARVTGRWLGEHAPSLKAVYDNVLVILPDEPLRELPLPHWAAAISAMLGSVYGHLELNPTRPDEAALLGALTKLADQTEEMASVDPSSPWVPRVTAAEAIDLFLSQLGEAVVPAEIDRAAVEVLGYLELPLDDAPLTIIAGVNEGAIPSSRNADALLPDTLRARLGLPDNRSRYARDLYALWVITRSRPKTVLVTGRRGADGDPLLPSRLLLACDQQTMIDRLEAFYDESPHPLCPPLIAPGRGDDLGLLLPPVLPCQPLGQLRVTAFRDYLACPYRFYLRHVLKLTGCDDQAVEMSGAGFGNLAHDVLGALATSDMAHSTDAKAIGAFLRDQLEREAARLFAGEATAAVRLQLQQLDERLMRFASVQAEHTAEGWRIMPEHAEKTHTATLDVDGQPFVITGRIDRIDQHPRLGYRIIDYKSADTPLRPENSHQAGSRDQREWIDLQLPLYRELARAAGIDGPLELGYGQLPRKLGEIGFAWAPWDSATIDEAVGVAFDVIRNIRAGVFWPPGDATKYPDEFSALCADAVEQRDGLIARSPGLVEAGDA